MKSLMDALTPWQLEHAQSLGVDESTLHSMGGGAIVGCTARLKRITFCADGGLSLDRSP